MSDLIDKLTAVVWEHYGEIGGTHTMDLDLLATWAALAAATIGNPAPDCGLLGDIAERRAIFDALVTKGLHSLSRD